MTIEKKVLFLSNHFNTLYWFRKELIARLINEGHSVFLSIPEDKNDYFKNIGCEVIITDIDRKGTNPLNDIKLIRFYKKIFNDINPEIIFSYTIKPNIYGCLANNGYYKQICNITGTGGAFINKGLLSTICKYLYKISLHKSYKVYFQNKGDKDFFVKNRLVKNNYEILPGSGCNLDEHIYTPMPTDEKIRFIFIGRIMKLKGIDEYLRAAKLIKSKYHNVEFLIAGWIEEKSYIEAIKEYENNGYVKYIGYTEQIDYWISKCHCIILPSHGGEGIPNVLLESGANGRACIVSNINGSVEVIDDEVNGYIFETGNVDSLTQKIEKFINLPSEKKRIMGNAGRKKIEIKYDRKTIINKYCQDVYKI